MKTNNIKPDLNLYTYDAKVLKVVDGDTVEVMVDLGFDLWIKQRVRFYGFNAPETRTRNKAEKIKGLAVKQKLEELLNVDTVVLLESRGVEKYGRCLGLLFKDGRDVCEILRTQCKLK